MSIALLTIVLLMSAGSASARTGGTLVPILGSAAQINAVTSAVNPTQILTTWASAIYFDGNDRHYSNHDDDSRNYRKHEGNKNGGDEDKHHGAPAPTPEPSTILSFGAALLIGGGVLYSRRLRGAKK
jgi:hypothetical protein